VLLQLNSVYFEFSSSMTNGRQTAVVFFKFITPFLNTFFKVQSDPILCTFTSVVYKCLLLFVYSFPISNLTIFFFSTIEVYIV